MTTVANALWDDFQIEGRSAAHASETTYGLWAAGQIVSPDQQDPRAVWNDALRLGYLLGAGLLTLADLRNPEQESR